MTRLAELLDAAVPPREPSFDERDVRRRARARQRRRRGGAGLALVVLLAAVVAFAAHASGGDVHPAHRIKTVTTTAPHGPGVFGVRTGVTLLFDAGHGLIAGVPLDGGKTRYRVVYPMDTGTRLVTDPLFADGTNLVIGHRDVSAVHLPTATGRSIAHDAYAVPATEPRLF